MAGLVRALPINKKLKWLPFQLKHFVIYSSQLSAEVYWGGARLWVFWEGF